MSRILPFVFAFYPLGLCVIALVWLYRARNQNRLQWAEHTLTAGSIIAFLYMTGPWVFTSYYLRDAVLVLYMLGAVVSYQRIQDRGGYPSGQKAPQHVFSMLVLILFTGLNAFTIGTLLEEEEGLDLSFPLSSGTYAVLQGGGNVITNPFHTLSGSRYALDLTKLNALGNRARGIAPRDLYAYEIFADTLQSPCSGTVLRVRDSLSDNTPGEIDTEHPEGNYVVLECANVEVLMAHLKQGSVLVTPGASVATGQLVGEIGNSGNTMEPHLHIEAKKGAAAIPLTFDGRSLSINSLVRGLSWLSDSTGYRTGAPIVNSP